MSKTTTKKEGENSELDEIPEVANSPQAQTEYKETPVILTDNRRMDYDQPNLNPNSEAIKRDVSSDDSAPQTLIMGNKDKKLKVPKPFKNGEEALKFIGKPILVLHGNQHQTAILHSVDATGVNAPEHYHYSFNNAYPWHGTKEQSAFEDAHAGDPAYDVTVKEGETEKKTGKHADEVNADLYGAAGGKATNPKDKSK